MLKIRLFHDCLIFKWESPYLGKTLYIEMEPSSPVFSLLLPNPVPNLCPHKFDKLPAIVISETAGTQKSFHNLKPNKAPGPDNIQAKGNFWRSGPVSDSFIPSISCTDKNTTCLAPCEGLVHCKNWGEKRLIQAGKLLAYMTDFKQL